MSICQEFSPIAPAATGLQTLELYMLAVSGVHADA